MRKIKGLECILLVDDDAIANLIHKRTIESAGIDLHVEVAQNGQEALDYLLGKKEGQFIKPGIIFLDINMPGMNGWEFMEQYNRLAEEFKVKAVVVLLTTSTHSGDREDADKNPGVQNFMNKTLSVPKLEELIESHFG